MLTLRIKVEWIDDEGIKKNTPFGVFFFYGGA